MTGADEPTHVTVGGLRTRVLAEGEGPPPLLIMGIWGGVSAWRPLVERLAGYRIIAFDAPGIGGTDCPAVPMPLPALGGFAAGVLDAVGVRRAHVLGVSFGGLVAQQMAVVCPHRVDALVLASTSSGVLHVPGQPAALLRLLAPWSADTVRDAGRVFGGRVRADPHLVTRLDLQVPGSPTAVVNRLTGLAGWWGGPWAIPHRTLVLTGDDDPIVPVQNSRILAACLPNARLHVVRGGGHLVLFDSPERVAPVIDGFLRQRGARTRRRGLGNLAS
jgi:poly(3-hydroxyoctanoate) depolymerase